MCAVCVCVHVFLRVCTCLSASYSAMNENPEIRVMHIPFPVCAAHVIACARQCVAPAFVVCQRRLCLAVVLN